MEQEEISCNIKDEVKLLSRREKEILTLLALGMKSSEISVKLGLSVRTVEWHRYNMLARFNIKSASQLAIFANEFVKRENCDIEPQKGKKQYPL